MKTKSNLLINDLSGIGKVALLPMSSILTSCGIELSVLPTCILSSHTGGFKNVYIDDYSKGMKEFLSQWSKLELKFESIITGYFRRPEQIDMVLDFIEKNTVKDRVLIVDPVMADGGKMYSGFTSNHVIAMRRLCEKAELILPNFTEACLLSDMKINEELAGIDKIKKLCINLSDKGNKSVVITGIKQKENIIIAYYDKKSKKFGYEKSINLAYNFFGTGDIFTALISAAYLKNISLNNSIKIANEWLISCLNYTIKLNRDIKYGVCFEPFLHELNHKLEKTADDRDLSFDKEWS